MSLEGLPVHWAVLLGLLAVIPAAGYGFERAGIAGFVTVVTVFIIVTALYVVTEPVSDGGHNHHGETDDAGSQ